MADSLGELRSELSLAWRIIRMRISAQAHYRRSFMMQLFGNTILTIMEIVAIVILFQRFPSLGGWSLNEVLLLFAMSEITFNIADSIQNGLDLVPDQVRTGEFDRLLTRPLSVYLQAMLLDISLRHVGKTILAVGLFTYAWTRVDPVITAPTLVIIASALICGTVLFIAIFSLGAIVSFWTVGSIEMINAISYGGSDLSQYPIHIYRGCFAGCSSGSSLWAS